MRYLKTHKLFDSVNKDGLQWTQIHLTCEKYGIKNFKVNHDGTVDVDGNVNIDHRKLKVLPVKFNIINGYFNCSLNELTTLEGAPKIVNGIFYCNHNKLTTLDNCPEYIKEDMYCNSNNLYSVKGYNGDIYNLELSNNPIITLISRLITDLKIFKKELFERLYEFDVLNNNTIDLLNLEKLYDFYNKKLFIDKFDEIKKLGYEIY